MKTWPSIDHSLLSPSGKMSKAARKRANERENKILFPDGYFDIPKPSPEEEARITRERKLNTAKELRELASRGMCPRKYLKEAERLEREITEGGTK